MHVLFIKWEGNSDLRFTYSKKSNVEHNFPVLSSLPEVVSQSRADVTKIDYIQITCGDGKRIFKFHKKNHKSPDPDGIPPIRLNELAEEISYLLTKIYLASLECRRLPKDWLAANVLPIYKGGQRVDPKNFHPVSLTSTCSKVMECIIKFVLIRFADSQQLMSETTWLAARTILPYEPS